MPDIEVVIRKGMSAEGVAVNEASSPTGESQVSGEEQGKRNLQKEAVNGALIQVGKTIISQGINQYGNLTGNYYASEVINAVTNIGSDLATLATAGPAGWVLIAGKYAVQSIASSVSHARKVQDHNFSVERLGRISTKGSRY